MEGVDGFYSKILSLVHFWVKMNSLLYVLGSEV